MQKSPPITLEQLASGDHNNKAAFFVGRKEIIDGIENTVAGIESSIKAECSDGELPYGRKLCGESTWLIQGATGAGKSTLLKHLQNKWEAMEDGPVVVNIEMSDLVDKSAVIRKIADGIIPGYGERILNIVYILGYTDRFDKIINGEEEVPDSLSSANLMLDDLRCLYGEDAAALCKRLMGDDGLPERPKLRPIVVMINGVHKFSSQELPMLVKVHMGTHGLPILALWAGHSYSKSMFVNKARFSRFARSGLLSHVQLLGRLEAGEAAESVKVMLSGYEIKGWDESELPEKIEAWSGGWPQHLEYYMVALAQQLIDNGRDLSRVDESAVRAAGDGRRIEYYRARLKGSPIAECKQLLADVAGLIGSDGCKAVEVLSMLSYREWEEGQHQSAMPEGMSEQEFLQAMIVAGVVYRDFTTITIPIPSLRQYLIDQGK